MKVTKEVYIKLRRQSNNPINVMHSLNNHYGKLKLTIKDFERTMTMWLLMSRKQTLLNGCAKIQKEFDNKFAQK